MLAVPTSPRHPKTPVPVAAAPAATPSRHVSAHPKEPPCHRRSGPGRDLVRPPSVHQHEASTTQSPYASGLNARVWQRAPTPAQLRMTSRGTRINCASPRTAAASRCYAGLVLAAQFFPTRALFQAALIRLLPGRSGLIGGGACRAAARGLQLRNLGANLRHHRHCGALAFEDRRTTLVEIGRADIVDLGANDHVGTFEFGLAQALAHDRDRLVHRAQQVPRVLAAGLAGNIHGHHEFGTQLACRVHRHRADHAAIDEVVLTDGHRLEHAGNAAGRAHCLAGIAAHEHGAFAIFQTRGDCRERLAQFFDRFAAQLFVDVVLQFLALHQATGKQPHIADAGLVERNGLFLHLERIHAAGIQRAHHAAGAGTGDHHRCEAVGLEHLDHPDMRKALGRTATERDADLDGLGGFGRRCLHHRRRCRRARLAPAGAEQTEHGQQGERAGAAERDHGENVDGKGEGEYTRPATAAAVVVA
ncbi:hypothetical protein XFF6166_70015 [Xanthomonas citri pv. fuscans]|nr:hypothetical protein XFF6166_70015 [Xanthomonas citri pv. fuscans]SON95597.1 hypothetical protein XFF7767_100006 [Xanthomonas citri pv. fuscans]SOO02069.1 hypothetical protein XFF6960_570030 [Xanthomonas citri pv. fuscans]SOO09502.1 hypothetical protein XFF6970_390024 [Xanthomonas citri pv. fuscans]SOO14775.1 hypothetical protein XFF7766_380016 [Xanthomonas citri pv. fuscans]